MAPRRGRPRLYASCLEFFSEKFKEAVADERGDQSNFKVGRGKNIFDCPNDTSTSRHAGAFKLAHQEISVEEEDNKRDLDHPSQDIFLHSRTRRFPFLGENTRARQV